VLGTLGFEDVDCEQIAHTYVRAHSGELDRLLRREVAAFCDDLRGVQHGQVSLEFYQKRRKWPFQEERVPWEVWTVKTEIVHFSSDAERRTWRGKVGEMLADKVMYVAEVMNRQDYVPVMYTKVRRASINSYALTLGFPLLRRPTWI